MKAAKRFLSVFLAALLCLCWLVVTANSQEASAVFGELKISSPDYETLGGAVSTLGQGSYQIVKINAAGRYVVEMAPGVTEAVRTVLSIASNTQVTLRDLRIKAPSARAVIEMASNGGAVTLTLEGGSTITCPSGGGVNTDYLVRTNSGVSLTFEGPGSLTLDARGSSRIGGIGKLCTWFDDLKNAVININSGTITAYGGEEMTGIGASNGTAGGAGDPIYLRGIDLTINGGTVTGVGGPKRDFNSKGAPGIGDMIHTGDNGRSHTNITINGGTVTAMSVGAPALFAGRKNSYTAPSKLNIRGGVVYAYAVDDEDFWNDIPAGVSGSGTIDGDAVVISNLVAPRVEESETGIERIRGLVFSENVGTVYGDMVTVTEDAEFPLGGALTVAAGQTVAVREGKTVQSYGLTLNNGTVLANMAGYGRWIPELRDIVYPVVTAEIKEITRTSAKIQLRSGGGAPFTGEGSCIPQGCARWFLGVYGPDWRGDPADYFELTDFTVEKDGSISFPASNLKPGTSYFLQMGYEIGGELYYSPIGGENQNPFTTLPANYRELPGDFTIEGVVSWQTPTSGKLEVRSNHPLGGENAFAPMGNAEYQWFMDLVNFDTPRQYVQLTSYDGISADGKTVTFNLTGLKPDAYYWTSFYFCADLFSPALCWYIRISGEGVKDLFDAMNGRFCTPALPHTHSYAPAVTQPTCTGQGFTTRTCSCGDSSVDTYTDPLGHLWADAWAEVDAPTEAAPGLEERYCQRPACAEKQQREIPKLGHTFAAGTPVPPTCEEEGYTVYACACGETQTKDYADPLGHLWADSWTEIDAPTEAAPGLEERYCQRPACAEKQQREIPKLGHTFVAGTPVPPTCEEGGYTVYACACGETQTKDYAGPLGHLWADSWTEVDAPTEAAPGLEERYCQRPACAEKQQREIPKLPVPSNNKLVSKNGIIIVDEYLHYIYGFGPGVTWSDMTANYLRAEGGSIVTPATQGETYVGTGFQLRFYPDPKANQEDYIVYTFVLFGDTGDGWVNAADAAECLNMIGAHPTAMTPQMFAMAFNNDSDLYAAPTADTRTIISNYAKGNAYFDFGDYAAMRYRVVKKWFEAHG